MLPWRSLQASVRSSGQLAPLVATRNASLAASKAPEITHESVNESQGRRRRKIPTWRPSISAKSPRKWNRPIAEGVIPAYDLALNLIQKDSLSLNHEANELRSQIDAAEAEIQFMLKKRDTGSIFETGVVEAKDKELESMRRRLHILEVQSEVNLPHIRWKVANALVDMAKPSQRHLLEQRWRKEGALDMLMERIHQMHVVPDVLPELHPSVDLHVTVTALPQEIRLKSTVDKAVEPGVFLLPQQTLKPPKLYANVFHTETRLYTMLLVDPDVPDAENPTYTTFLHWMKPNIPLSASSCGPIPDLNNHTTYIPPHPQRGTPYHRYVLLLLPQPPASGTSNYTLNMAARVSAEEVTSVYLNIPMVSDVDRKGFDVRAFTKHWGLNELKGGGAHMFRQIWDEDVSRIYTEIHKQEPRYGLPRKPDPYIQLKQTKRYI